jgi:hypothetical protein
MAVTELAEQMPLGAHDVDAVRLACSRTAWASSGNDSDILHARRCRGGGYAESTG